MNRALAVYKSGALRSVNIYRACEPIPNAAWDDLSVGSSKGPFLHPVSHGFSFWMVYITAPRFDPDLEAAVRSVPHPVSLRDC